MPIKSAPVLAARRPFSAEEIASEAKIVQRTVKSFISSLNTMTVSVDPLTDTQILASYVLGVFAKGGGSSHPWVEAWDLPKLFSKMKALGYSPGSIVVAERKCLVDFTKSRK